MPRQPRLTAKRQLELVRIAVYSVGETITAAQAISLIAHIFDADPVRRINGAMLPTLQAMITESRIAAPAERRRRLPG